MKKLIPLTMFALLLGFFTMNSCTKEVAPLLPPPADTAYYQADIVPILQTYCYGVGTQKCHVANTTESAPWDFAQYIDLKTCVDGGAIHQRVFTLKDMPASFSAGPKVMTNSDLQKFQSWVAAGAKND